MQGADHHAPSASVVARVAVVGADPGDQALMEVVGGECARRGVEAEQATIQPYRQPEELRRWVDAATARGVRVMVAIGGTAPHLPGLLAAMTTIPVIGVAARSAALSAAESVVALLALPPGVPLAVAGLDDAGARNAAALALAILAQCDTQLTAGLPEQRAAAR
jgi:5-(carboxyamino)imidazole ribonucleotide mutase